MKKISTIFFALLVFGTFPPLCANAQEFVDDPGYGAVEDPSYYGAVEDPSYYGSPVEDPSYYGSPVEDPSYGYPVEDPSYAGYPVEDPSYYSGGGTYPSAFSNFSLGNYTPSPIGNYCGNACIYPTSSSYGLGGTQGYGGYGNGWGVSYGSYGYGNYGYSPVFGYGGTQYAASYPAYQYAQYPQYKQPTYYQPQTVQNYTMTWGNVNTGPVLFSKPLGTSVPLFGDYPSCVIYFLPGDTDNTRGLKWSGININQAMLSGYGQVTGEGYMQVPYNGQPYTLTVWDTKGQTATCSTR